MNCEEKTTFKTCPSCGTVWQNREAFLKDRSLHLNGYQVDFRSLDDGLFLFTHTIAGCNSTFAIKVEGFSDLYSGIIFSERRTGEDDCPGYCRKEDQLDRCKAMCECAYVREIIQIVKEY